MIPDVLHPLLAEAVLAAGTVLLLLLSCVKGLRARAGDVALIVMAATAVAAVASMDAPQGWLVAGWIVADPWAAFFKFVLSMSAMATVWMGTRSRAEPAPPAWSWPLLALSLLGMFVMVAAANMAAAWIGLQVVSVSTASWIALQRHDDAGGQAISSLWIGAAASAVTLLGFALLFGLTGTLDYAGLAARLPLALTAPGARQVVQTALVLVLAGLGAGIAMLPWHAWRADLAERAPLAVSAWCFTGGTLAGLAMLGRFSRSVLSVAADDGQWIAMSAVDWPSMLSVAAMATMSVGNIAALREGDARRLLAWLSVAQTGSLMMGLAVMNDRGLQAMLFHSVVCTIMNVAVLAALAPVLEATGSAHIDMLRGLARRRGVAIAVAGAIAMVFLSLAAVPPLAGFTGRSLLLTVVFEADRPVLGLVAAINSIIVLVCSLRVIAILLEHGQATPSGSTESGSPGLAADFEAVTLVSLLLAATIGIGVWPGALQSFAERSVVFFAG